MPVLCAVATPPATPAGDIPKPHISGPFCPQVLVRNKWGFLEPSDPLEDVASGY